MKKNTTPENSAQYLIKLIGSRGLPRNQLAAFSGLSNAYIQHLENGQITNVDRKKIIAISVALNLTLHQIDKLLSLFDRSKLSENDIPAFINPGVKRDISSALLPLQASFTYELVILIGESLPGRLVIVNDQPTASLVPKGYRSYFYRNFEDPHPLCASLIEAVGQARKASFFANLQHHPIEHYVCRKCLETYIQHNDCDEEKEWKKKHLTAVIDAVRRYENFTFLLTDNCSRMNFSIKTAQGSPKTNDKLFFLGKAPHSSAWENNNGFIGFATANQTVVRNFKSELQAIRNNIVPESENRDDLLAYLHNLCETHLCESKPCIKEEI